MSDTPKPRIGVSRCLLGDAVRYDGASKPCSIILEQFAELFELIAVCPEVEAGLPVPRPPVQLTGSLEQPRMTGRDDPTLDVTNVLNDYCEKRIPQLETLSGFIFKSRSPSCGLGSTPVFVDGKCVTEWADGVFVRAFRCRYPDITIIDELALQNVLVRNEFVKAILQAQQQKAVE